MRNSLSSPISALEKVAQFCSQAVQILITLWSPGWKGLLDMLAPLRRIVSRSMEVYKFHRETPEQFVIHEKLECGHAYTSLQWGLRDLLCAYTENSEATARRRRCHECAAAIAKKRPDFVRLAGRKQIA